MNVSPKYTTKIEKETICCPEVLFIALLFPLINLQDHMHIMYIK